MSFLTEAATRRLATLQVPRTLATSAPRAAFSSSVTLQRTPVEAAKDTLKTVDRAVSDKLVDGIDITSMYCHTSSPLIPLPRPFSTPHRVLKLCLFGQG